MDIKKRTLTTIEVSVLKNDLLDIQDWVTKAIDGKVNNCKKRMIAEWTIEYCLELWLRLWSLLLLRSLLLCHW